MKTYKIEYEKQALKFIKSQPQNQIKRIFKAVGALPDGDIKKLKGATELYRLRVGDYRILYTIKYDVLIITVIDAGNRGQVYDNY